MIFKEGMRLKVGVKNLDETFTGTITCVHPYDFCVKRDDGVEGIGCKGAWFIRYDWCFDEGYYIVTFISGATSQKPADLTILREKLYDAKRGRIEVGTKELYEMESQLRRLKRGW